MDFVQTAKKALTIIGQHSANPGIVQSSNSLQFAELDVDACVPLLNELYEIDINCEELDKSISILDFLKLWDPDVDLYSKYLPSVIKNENVEIEQSEESDIQNPEETNTIPSKPVKLNWLHKISITVLFIYLCFLFINRCTSLNNELTQNSEGTLNTLLKGLSWVDTIVDPSNWISGLAQLAFGDVAGYIICIVVFAFLILIGIIVILSEKECQVYYHQPFISFIVLLLAINKGIFGAPQLNAVWSIGVPLTFILFTAFGISIVYYGLKLFHPHNKYMKNIIQVIPLVIWLLLLHIFY